MSIWLESSEIPGSGNSWNRFSSPCYWRLDALRVAYSEGIQDQQCIRKELCFGYTCFYSHCQVHLICCWGILTTTLELTCWLKTRSSTGIFWAFSTRLALRHVAWKTPRFSVSMWATHWWITWTAISKFI